MKSWRKIGAVALAAAVVTSSAACANNTNNEAGKSGEKADGPVTLKWMLWKDEPKDMPQVLQEFEKRTKDTLNTSIKIEWSGADHKEKSKLRMAAGEEVDLMFDAPFMNLNNHVSQGLYQELDKYFNNDAYPGLKKAFSLEMVEKNKILGHNYTIPLTQYWYDTDVIFIRKDLREKYGLPPIQSYDDLQKFYDKVQELDKNIVPLALRGERGFYKIHDLQFTKDTPIISDSFGSGIGWTISLSADGKKVNGLVAAGDPQSEFDKLPAPYNDTKLLYSSFAKYVEWNKYLEKDVVSQKDPAGFFTSGKAASTEGTVSGYTALQKRLKDSIPNAGLEMFVYNNCQREMKSECIGTNYVANNSLVIPTTSKNIDRTMKVLDWIFQNKENHDLFELGVEGKNWQAVGKDQYKLLNADYSNFPAYELTWNPSYVRINADLDDTVKKYLAYSAKPDTYFTKKLSGFRFNAEPVKNEIAKVTPKVSNFNQLAKLGLIKDYPGEVSKLNQELKGLGLDKLREELRKQLQEYLDKGGK
ncbi:ABC transporter substrate-binding protein [Paenibacillus rigui]|uniref:ABC transporter substrate-binding protein n=1 Tax=Paenibacillus rigui TaxID=554312 RepID=A0A229UPU7_9BACL|nr:ABC transporter substrate-binding protein [Paenibacillus rigui]OXM85393.1 ABC transporter substrate-binding protein [Paenibacillus rigui]